MNVAPFAIGRIGIGYGWYLGPNDYDDHYDNNHDHYDNNHDHYDNNHDHHTNHDHHYDLVSTAILLNSLI